MAKVTGVVGGAAPHQRKAASSGDSLTLEGLDKFIDSGYTAPTRTLVAPNKQMAKEWAQMYPGWTILLSSREVGAKRPTHQRKARLKI